LFKYIKKAFLFHWNLLCVSTGLAISFISKRPDVLLPAFTALEVLYLAILSSHPRFQEAVNAEEHKKNLKHSLSSKQKLNQILSELNKEDLNKYERLKNLCLELHRIADRVKGHTEEELEVISGVQVNSINRLLWMYLKLLYSKNALESYFKTINMKEIKEHIELTKKRLEGIGSKSKNVGTEAIRRVSLMDTLEISQKRLENYRICMEKYDFIELELERVNTKITSLAEIGINRQDPTLIASEINVVSSSIEKTEKAMDELDFITGLSLQDEEPPDLLAEDKNKEIPNAEKGIL
jgi:hypothetical protein